MTIELCPTCGSWTPHDCRCVRQRTYRSISLAKSVDVYDRNLDLDSYLPPVYLGHARTDPRAPRHTGGMWTCRHAEHSPTEERGLSLTPGQSHAHRFQIWNERKAVA